MLSALKSLVLLTSLVSLFIVAPQAYAGADVKLQAGLSGSTAAKGKAVYEERGTTRRKLKVEGQNATPTTTYTIIVKRDDAILASIDVTTNALGRFSLELDTERRQSVPTLKPGDIVSVWLGGQIVMQGSL